MPRRTVRVDMPTSKPEEMLKLADKVIKWHEAPSNASKLDATKMTDFKAALTKAQKFHDDGKDFEAKAQAANQKRNGYLGLNHTPMPGDAKLTVLEGVTYARKQSLLDFAGNEEEMTNQGFNVVIGTAKSPTKSKPA